MSSVTHDADLAVTGKVSQTGTPSADSDLITKVYADANYGGGGSALTVSESGTPVDITVAIIDFGNGFDVVEGPEDEVNVSLDLGEYTGTDLLVASGGTGASDAATALANLGGQPLDADLTTIAGLAATTGNFIVSEASAWASRTPAQVRTTLALVIGTDVQAFAADLTSLATNWIQASAAGASSLDFHEDTDNGVNRVRLIGPAATADVTVTLPAATDTLVGRDTIDTLTNKTISQAQITNLTTDLSNKQPLDTDLTTIAGLAATTDNFIVSVASAWASRTPAQVRTTLGLVIGTDVQAFSADLSSLVTNWIQASAAGPSSLDFHEDTDNGVNRVRLVGPATTADVTVTLPAVTAGLVPDTRLINTTAPVTGGGDLTADRTIAVSAATATAVGVVELLTPAEVSIGTDTTRAMTAEGAASTYVKEITFTVPGTLIVGTGVARYYLPTARTISAVRASVGTAPTGASVIVDVHKNGTTIYGTQGNRPTIAISGFTDLGEAASGAVCAAADYLTVDVDQIGSTIAGADLTVTIVF